MNKSIFEVYGKDLDEVFNRNEWSYEQKNQYKKLSKQAKQLIQDIIFHCNCSEATDIAVQKIIESMFWIELSYKPKFIPKR